jgi:tetratricopeptide (TPR) repeat protein
VEALAGDLAAAVAAGVIGCNALEQDGDLGVLSTYAAILARLLCQVGRLDEAELWAERGRVLGAEDDAMTQVLWRQAKALIAAQRGGTEEAVALARSAVAISLETDMLHEQGDAYADLAEVAALAGDATGAAEAYEQAVGRYRQKGNVVAAKRAQARLDDLKSLTA